MLTFQKIYIYYQKKFLIKTCNMEDVDSGYSSILDYNVCLYTDGVKMFKKKYNINKVDFLKVDCEGAEGFIFLNSSKSDWLKIKKVSIEYHDSVSILKHHIIIKKLTEFGFKTKLMKSDETYGYIYAWK